MGLFSKDYESAGSGLSKDAPKKKGLALYFDIFRERFWTFFLLNILYYLAFIPLTLAFSMLGVSENYKLVLTVICICLLAFAVLIGPATAGLVKVMRLFIIDQHAFVVRDFFRGFKANFKRGAIISLLDSLIFVSCYAAFRVYPDYVVKFDNKLWFIPMIITLSFGLVVLMMNFYIYPMLVALDLSLKDLFKNAFILSVLAIKSSLLMTFIYIAAIVLMTIVFIYKTVIFLMLVPLIPMAIVWFTLCFISYPVIQKYIINPFYASKGEVNPEIAEPEVNEEEVLFEDMGGKEAPIEKRKKGKGKRIS